MLDPLPQDHPLHATHEYFTLVARNLPLIAADQERVRVNWFPQSSIEADGVQVDKWTRVGGDQRAYCFRAGLLAGGCKSLDRRPLARPTPWAIG